MRSPSPAYLCFFLVTVGEKAGLGHGCIQKIARSLALTPSQGREVREVTEQGYVCVGCRCSAQGEKPTILPERSSIQNKIAGET